MASLEIGERPYMIRRCPNCGNWHLFKMEVTFIFITPIIIYTAKSFFDMLVVINFSTKNLLNHIYGEFGETGE